MSDRRSGGDRRRFEVDVEVDRRNGQRRSGSERRSAWSVRSGRPRRMADRYAATRLLRWWIAGIVVIGVAVWANTKHIDDNADRLDRALHGSCERVNDLRGSDNKNAETQYETLRAASTLIPDTLLAARFKTLMGTIDYLPPTDCEAAVGTPREFVPPRPIPLHTLTEAQRETIRRKGHL